MKADAWKSCVKVDVWKHPDTGELAVGYVDLVDTAYILIGTFCADDSAVGLRCLHLRLRTIIWRRAKERGRTQRLSRRGQKRAPQDDGYEACQAFEDSDR